MADERNQLKATDVQDRLCRVKDKITFLYDAIVPAGAEGQETMLGMDHNSAQGLGLILREIEGELQEIAGAEIVTAVAHD